MFRLLKLEDRIVLDGAGLIDVLEDGEANQDHDLNHDADAGFDGAELIDGPLSEGPDAAEAVNVLVVASDLPDADVLAGAAKSGVVVLQYDAENVDLSALGGMIDEALGGRPADSIAFATHGGNLPAVKLGEGAITSLDTLEDDADVRAFWAGIGGLVSDGGRIDLLACDVAEDAAAGQAFLDGLEDLTGRNVAASADATGNEAYGGNWVLESDGVDVSGTYFDADALAGYAHQLGGAAPQVVGDIPNLSPSHEDGLLVYSFPVESVFRDAEGDPLTIEAAGLPDWADGDSGFGLLFFPDNLFYGRTGDGTSVGNEAGQSFTVTVTASDGTSSSAPVDVKITVPGEGEQTPAFDQPSYNAGTIPEYSGNDQGTMPGAEIFDLGGKVVDNGTGFGYRIAAGDPTGDTFAIDAAGRITLNNADRFDFEDPRNPSHKFSLVVEVEDEEGLYGNALVNLELSDVVDETVPADPVATIALTGAVATIDELAGESATFTVALDGTAEADTIIALTYGGDAAAARYAGPASVTIFQGSDSATFKVTTADNSVEEGLQTLQVSLVDGAEYDVGTPGQAAVAITDVGVPDFPDATIALTGGTAPLDELAGESATFTITLDGPVEAETNISLTYGGDAAAGRFSGPTSVTVAQDASSATFKVTTADNSVEEGLQNLVVNIAAGIGYDVGATSTAAISITDVEIVDLPDVVIALTGDASLDERAGEFTTFTLTLESSAESETVVNLSYAGAAAGRFSGPATASIAQGATAATFQVTTADNGVQEGLENLVVTVEPGAGYDVGATGAATVSITDVFVPEVAISASPINIYEFSGAGPTQSQVTVFLDEPAASTVSVGLALSGTATTPDGETPDYEISNTAVTFEPGQKSFALTITALEDNEFNEPDETLKIALVNPDGVIVNESQEEANLTIFEASRPFLTVSGGGEIWEDAGDDPENPDAPLTSTVTLSLSRILDDAAVAVVLNVDTNAPADEFTATVGGEPVTVVGDQWVINIPAGQETLDIQIAGVEDAEFDLDYAINLSVDEVARARLDGAGTASVTIRDNDAPPTISLAAAGGLDFTEGGIASFKIQSDGPLTAPVDVVIDPAGVAGAGTDFDATLGIGGDSLIGDDGMIRATIPAGQSEVSVTLVGTPDFFVEGTETFDLTLSEAPDRVIIDDAANVLNGTIADGTAAPTALALDVQATSNGDATATPPTFNEDGNATVRAELTLATNTQLATGLTIAIEPSGVAKAMGATADYKVFADAARTQELAFDADAGAWALPIGPDNQEGDLLYVVDFYLGGATDQLVEGDEDLTLTPKITGLIDGTSADLRIVDITEGTGQAELVINVDAATVPEDGSAVANFAVRLEDPANPGAVQPVVGSVTVQVTLEGVVAAGAVGSAVELGTDYTLTGPEGDIATTTFDVVFAEGETEKVFTLTGVADPVDAPIFEGDETVNFAGEVTGGGAAGTASNSVVIEEGNPEPSVSLGFLGDAAFSESVGGKVMRVELSHPSVFPVTAPIRFAEGATSPATLGDDFIPPGGMETMDVTVPANETVKTLTAQIVDDDFLEDDEQFTVSIDGDDAAIVNGLLGDPSEAAFTIQDDDADKPPQVAVLTDVNTIDEAGNAVATVDVFVDRAITTELEATLTFSGDADFAGDGQDYTVTRTSDGTVIAPDPTTGEYVIPFPVAADSQTVSFTVAGISDTDFEGDEPIAIELTSVIGGNSATGFAVVSAAAGSETITLTDDSTEPTVSLSFLDGINEIKEGDGGEFPSQATLVAELSGTTVGEVLVTLSAVGNEEGAALPGDPGQDFTRTPQTWTISIPEGETSGTILLTAVNDDVFEGPETFDIQMETVTGFADGGTLPGTPVTLSIVDKAEPPLVSVTGGVDIYEDPAEIPNETTAVVSLASESLDDVALTVEIGGDAEINTNETLAAPPAGDYRMYLVFDGAETLIDDASLSGRLSGTEEAPGTTYSFNAGFLNINWAEGADQTKDIGLKFEALNDDVPEGNQPVTVNITGVDEAFATIDTAAQTTTFNVVDDDVDPPTVSLDINTGEFIESGAGLEGIVNVLLDAPAVLEFDLDLTFTPTSGSLAIPGEDFQVTYDNGADLAFTPNDPDAPTEWTTTVTVAQAATGGILRFFGEQDAIFEGEETFDVEITAVSPEGLAEISTVAGEATAAMTLLDDDVLVDGTGAVTNAPVISLVRTGPADFSEDPADTENPVSTTVQVSLDKPVGVDTVVLVTLADQTQPNFARYEAGAEPTDAQDFKVMDGETDITPAVVSIFDVTIPAGETEAEFKLVGMDDEVFEVTEQIEASLENAPKINILIDGVGTEVDLTLGENVGIEAGVLDNDEGQKPTLNLGALLASFEEATTQTFDITLSSATGADTRVRLDLGGAAPMATPGDTTIDGDYRVAVGGTVLEVLMDGSQPYVEPIIPAGAESLAVTLIGVSDGLFESDENIALTVAQGDILEDDGTGNLVPSGAQYTDFFTPGANLEESTLLVDTGADVPRVSISASPVEIYESPDPAADPALFATATFTLTLDNPSGATTIVTLQFDEANSTADLADFDVLNFLEGEGLSEPENGLFMVEIPPDTESGNPEGFLQIIAKVDDAFEPNNENVVFEIIDVDNAEFTAGTNAETVIVDANDPPVLTLTTPTEVNEGVAANITVSLNAASGVPTEFTMDFVQGTEPGQADFDDYQVDGATLAAEPQTFIIPAGDEEIVISLAALNDGLFEGPETLQIVPGTVTDGNATWAATEAQAVTILDANEDQAPTVFFSYAGETTATEGQGTLQDDAGFPAILSVEMSDTSFQDENIRIQLTGTAQLSTDIGINADGVPVEVTDGFFEITIPAESQSTDIVVQILDPDEVFRTDRTFGLEIVGVSTGSVGPSLVTIDDTATTALDFTIEDDDDPFVVKLVADRTEMVEAGGVVSVTAELYDSTGTNPIQATQEITVTLGANVEGIDPAVAATLPGEEGADFAPVVSPVQLVIPVGQDASGLVAAYFANADDAPEPNEQFKIVADAVTNALWDDVASTVTIVDDDYTPPVSQNDVFWIVENTTGQVFQTQAEAEAAAGDPGLVATGSLEGSASLLLNNSTITGVTPISGDGAFTLSEGADGLSLVLEVATALEFDDSSSYNVEVSVSDGIADPVARTFLVNILDSDEEIPSNPIPDTTWETADGALIYAFDADAAFPKPGTKILFSSPANPSWINLEADTSTFWALPGDEVPPVGSSLPVTVIGEYFDGFGNSIGTATSNFTLTIASLEETELFDALDYLEEDEADALPQEDAVRIQEMLVASAADPALDEAPLYAEALALLEAELAA